MDFFLYKGNRDFIGGLKGKIKVIKNLIRVGIFFENG